MSSCSERDKKGSSPDDELGPFNELVLFEAEEDDLTPCHLALRFKNKWHVLADLGICGGRGHGIYEMVVDSTSTVDAGGARSLELRFTQALGTDPPGDEVIIDEHEEHLMIICQPRWDAVVCTSSLTVGARLLSEIDPDNQEKLGPCQERTETTKEDEQVPAKATEIEFSVRYEGTKVDIADTDGCVATLRDAVGDDRFIPVGSYALGQ